ncbi:hypothetical protein ACFOG5_24160 [Pedobacter fastidiosus]
MKRLILEILKDYDTLLNCNHQKSLLSISLVPISSTYQAHLLWHSSV